MRHATLARSLPCPIARTLDVVGEWWSLLIIRDALLGARRFDDFLRSGISESTLATRLKKLTKAGILDRSLYQTSPRRYEYILTEKGKTLAPIVLALRQWGRRWTTGADFSEIVHEDCGGEITVGLTCEKCERTPESVVARLVESKSPAKSGRARARA